jgi:hypothetical protein
MPHRENVCESHKQETDNGPGKQEGSYACPPIYCLHDFHIVLLKGLVMLLLYPLWAFFASFVTIVAGSLGRHHKWQGTSMVRLTFQEQMVGRTSSFPLPMVGAFYVDAAYHTSDDQ